MENNETWQLCKADVFWGEIAPCDHVVQIYENNALFVELLAGFVGSGINAGDSVIVIATDEHLKALEEKLADHVLDTAMLKTGNHYIPLNAAETLSSFMVDGWPDEKLFIEVVTHVVKRASRSNRKIRAFGEMVALLWAQGNYAATVQLEHLWNRFCEKQALCLYCAYPKTGFTKDLHSSIGHICSSHSKMIKSSAEKPLTELYYKAV